MITSMWIIAALAVAAVSANQYQEELVAAIKEKGGDALLWEPGTNYGIGNPDDFLQSSFGDVGLSAFNSKDHCKSTCSGLEHHVDPTLPESFDSRKKWPQCDIGKAPDQGQCKSDYALSVTQAIANRFCIASNGTVKPTISAQQVVSCCKDCGRGCKGGISQEVWHYAARRGITSGGDYDSREGCQPYLKPPTGFSANQFYEQKSYSTPKCSYKCYNDQYPKSKAKEDLHKGTTPDRRCCCSVKSDLFKKGPITTSMILFEDFLTYKSGLYHHVHGKRLGRINVKIIGYGVENKVEYYIAVNNWGTQWGDNGTFKIVKGKNHCEFDDYFYAGDVVV